MIKEVAVGERGDAGRAWLANEGARFIVKAVPPLPSKLNDADLGSGETEVLSWALHHPGFKVVLDDRRGRIWAERLSLPLLGSLGVVVLMKRAKLIAAAAPVLEQIRGVGGFVSDAAIQSALAQAGES